MIQFNNTCGTEQGTNICWMNEQMKDRHLGVNSANSNFKGGEIVNPVTKSHPFSSVSQGHKDRSICFVALIHSLVCSLSPSVICYVATLYQLSEQTQRACYPAGERATSQRWRCRETVRGVVNFSTYTVNTEHELLTLLCVDVTPELGSERPVRTSQARGLGTKKMLQKEAIMSTKAQGASSCQQEGGLRLKPRAEPGQESCSEAFVLYLEGNGGGGSPKCYAGQWLSHLEVSEQIIWSLIRKSVSLLRKKKRWSFCWN